MNKCLGFVDMHEIGLVEDIISVIDSKLKGMEPGSKVKAININIGELEHVTPGHFEFHFRERAKGTALESVKLNFKKIEAMFRCKNCKFEFSPGQGLSGCPACKSKITDVISGAGTYLESIEVE